MELKCHVLVINYCNFSSNYPLIQSKSSMGGVFYAYLNYFLINNSIFINNSNFNGGCFFFEQHEKFNSLFGNFENLLVKKTTVGNNGGVLSMSLGIFYFNFTVKNCDFEENAMKGCI